MSSNNSPINSTPNDYLAAVARVGLGMVPFLGSALAEVVTSIIPNQRLDRVASFLESLDRRLKSFECQIETGSQFSDSASKLIEDGMISSARARSFARIEQIASVVSKGIEKKDREKESERMLWLLNDLTDEEVIVLRGALPDTNSEYELDEEFQLLHSDLVGHDFTDNESTEEEFDKEAIKQSYRSKLISLGLMDDSRSITRLGRKLLHYLELIPSWYGQ